MNGHGRAAGILAQVLAAWIGSDLCFAVGLLLFAVDALTAVLLYRIAASRGDRRRALFPALLFFANPVSMLISSAHGQFDNISILFLLLAVFFILSLFLLRRVEVARASLLLFLVLLIFTPGIGVQYFVWPIALGALFSGPGYLLYTAVTAVFFLQAGPGGSDASFGPTWHGPWLAAVVWLLWEIRSLRRNREAQVRVSCSDRRGRD